MEKLTKERRIHYIDSFKFSFVLPVYTKFRYEIKVRTTGLNNYHAGLEHRFHEWYCHNCELDNNEITVFVRNHNLAPGKLYCQVTLFDHHGKEVESMGIDPHITLTYDHIHNDKAPSDVDTQQSIDIIRLYDHYHQLKDKVVGFEDDVKNRTSVKDIDGDNIPVMWITYEDEFDAPIYTKEQIHERFVAKDEINKYVKKRELNDELKSKVEKHYLDKNYFTKSECYNIFIKQDDFYTKEEVDKMLLKLKKDIEALQS